MDVNSEPLNLCTKKKPIAVVPPSSNLHLDENSDKTTFQMNLESFFNQQHSLYVAKSHLEEYLEMTNLYLERMAKTCSENLSNLIRTNILTNKIATNNLILIINKLMEQNTISEYCYKYIAQQDSSEQAKETIVNLSIKLVSKKIKNIYFIYVFRFFVFSGTDIKS